MSKSREAAKSSKNDEKGGSAPPQDVLFDAAMRVVFERGSGGVAMLQRRLNVGYARASQMIQKMVAMGILEESKGFPRRRLAMTQAEYEAERAD